MLPLTDTHIWQLHTTINLPQSKTEVLWQRSKLRLKHVSTAMKYPAAADELGAHHGAVRLRIAAGVLVLIASESESQNHGIVGVEGIPRDHRVQPPHKGCSPRGHNRTSQKPFAHPSNWSEPSTRKHASCMV